MPVGKLTAHRYGSVSAIGNCVTDVTRERSAGTRHRQQAKKRSKNLSSCCSRDTENGFDREDVIHSVEGGRISPDCCFGMPARRPGNREGVASETTTRRSSSAGGAAILRMDDFRKKAF